MNKERATLAGFLIIILCMIPLLLFLTKENIALQNENRDLRARISEMEDRLSELRARLALFTLQNPTWDELRAFLKGDDTDERGTLCPISAWRLRLRAREKGWNMSYVLVNFWFLNDSKPVFVGHALNGIWLANGTWVWIEPSNDDVDQDLESLLTRLVGAEPHFTLPGPIVIW